MSEVKNRKYRRDFIGVENVWHRCALCREKITVPADDVIPYCHVTTGPSDQEYITCLKCGPWRAPQRNET